MKSSWTGTDWLTHRGQSFSQVDMKLSWTGWRQQREFDVIKYQMDKWRRFPNMEVGRYQKLSEPTNWEIGEKKNL